jgi:hypothetical protein
METDFTTERRQLKADNAALHKELMEGLYALKGQPEGVLEKYLRSRLEDFKKVSFTPVDASEFAFLENVVGMPKVLIKRIYKARHGVFVFATLTSDTGEWPRPMIDFAVFAFDSIVGQLWNYPADWAERIGAVLEGEEVRNG